MIKQIRKHLHKKATHTARHKHKKGFSKKWGFIVLAVLLLGIAVAIPQLSNNQSLFGRAAFYVGNDDQRYTAGQNKVTNRTGTSCSTSGGTGTCKNPQASLCSNGYYDYSSSNSCGNKNLKCCVVNIKNSPQCAKRGGKCERVGTHGGVDRDCSAYYSNYNCPGPDNIQCFAPRSLKEGACTIIKYFKTNLLCTVLGVGTGRCLKTGNFITRTDSSIKCGILGGKLYSGPYDSRNYCLGGDQCCLRPE